MPRIADSLPSAATSTVPCAERPSARRTRATRESTSTLSMPAPCASSAFGAAASTSAKALRSKLSSTIWPRSGSAISALSNSSAPAGRILALPNVHASIRARAPCGDTLPRADANRARAATHATARRRANRSRRRATRAAGAPRARARAAGPHSARSRAAPRRQGRRRPRRRSGWSVASRSRAATRRDAGRARAAALGRRGPSFAARAAPSLRAEDRTRRGRDRGRARRRARTRRRGSRDRA